MAADATDGKAATLRSNSALNAWVSVNRGKRARSAG